MGRTAISQ